jgi:AcrR family transcriptional regulator
LPKVIENAREMILKTAKNTLLSDGYDRLSLRGVSRQCNIAVGTIYNYFPSKIALITAIMLEDWKDQTEKMQNACANAENAEAGIQSIFASLHEFALLYQDVWNMSMHSKEVRDEMINGRSRRQVLIEQLAGIIRTLLERFEIPFESFLPYFITTSLLAYISEPDFDYEQTNKIFKRILYGNTDICIRRSIV